MPRARKVDSNQKQLVDILRQLGASVYISSSFGEGFSDIVVGYMGVNVLCEIKHARGKLTPAQQEFHRDWNGVIIILYTVDDAIDLIHRIRMRQLK